MAGAGKRRNAKRGAANRDTGHQEAAYDGPGSDVRSTSRGRTPSNAPTAQSGRASSRAGSQVRSGSRNTQGVAQDRTRDDSPRVLSRNVDFGGNAYNIFSQMPTQLMLRPDFGKGGKVVPININSHEVAPYSGKNIFQYDVQIGSGAEKRGLIKAVWESNAVKKAIGEGFIFDGNKLGWTYKDFPKEIRFTVDLDAERNIPPRPGHENRHQVRINKAKNGRIVMEALHAYLNRTADFSNTVLEAINFLDHLLRETPSKKHINLRRSYFARAPDRDDTYLLGGGIEAMKGVYQSLRAAQGGKLIINVDVSNSCFWHQTGFMQLGNLINGENDMRKFITHAQIRSDGKEPLLLPFLRRLHKNQFIVRHRGQSEKMINKIWTLKRISPFSAKTYKFDVKERETGKVTNMSMFDYFLKKYNCRIDNHNLPLLETTKPGVLFPMEMSAMCGGQRYPYKLNEEQTSKMIKFAVSRPPVRKQAIDHGLAMLDWQNDPFLKHYGLNINPNMLKTTARILDPPEVLFAKNATAKPVYSGRWDLRGKVFFKPNSAPLKSWGVVALMPGQDRRPPVTQDQVLAFIQNFLKLYRGHGGRVENASPPIMMGIPDTAKAIESTFMAAGNQSQMRPQMIMVILTNRAADVYNRVKKSCDCRYGVMSQCVQASNVLKNQPQYCSNVLMKFNCKLGGTTSAIKARKNYFDVPTMIIGADVSHAAPGAITASMAAISVSMDATCSRYAAGVQTNGYRVEMITTSNLEELIGPLLQHWMENVSGGRLPQHVYYFRDGVSEGQYTQVLKQEVADLKRIFFKKGGFKPEFEPKFTVVVAEKRHHIRFFPPQGPAADKNGNPLPGTIVERDVTHPFENDFYLCSHVAIQGTARPTHYHMLMDEMKVNVDKFQALLYEHCYQYQRATTPVSLFPAVYYAHLAAARGIGHINKAETELWLERKEKKKHPGAKQTSSDDSLAEAPPLMPFEPKNGIQYGMWYI